MLNKKDIVIKLGNRIFHYRNLLFPFLYATLFIPTPEIFSGEWAVVNGVVLISTGMFIRIVTIGFDYIKRGGLNRNIHATNLVIGGIYSLCRNPMYLGNILILAGFGILANSLIFILLFFPLFVFLYYSIIKAEEAFLLNKFGEEYKIYKNSVNALLPNLKKIESAVKNYQFNWKRVLSKEYNSFFIYLMGIKAIRFNQGKTDISSFLIYAVIIIVLYCTVRFLKKNHFLD